MSDLLVQRLREQAEGGGRYVRLGLMSEAADRIEALEAQAREQALRYLALDTQAEALLQRQEADAALLRQALSALEYEAYGQHPPAPETIDAIAAIRARLESDAK